MILYDKFDTIILMLNESKQLNNAQKEAVLHTNGPLLIVAGAGTGKTTVITERIANLINSGLCKPDEILALTFTDKAAGEVEERVDKLLPYGYVDLWVSTFHSFAERILNAHGLEIGLPNDFKLLNPTEQWLLVRNNLSKFKLDYYKPLGNPTKFIHALLKHFSRAKDEGITPEEYLQYIEEIKSGKDIAFLNDIINPKEIEKLTTEELNELQSEEIRKQSEVGECYQAYQQLLLDNSALDFGDMINYCLKLFKERKNILLKYRTQFKYILIDEFQDTNLSQYNLIKILAGPLNNITVVGDDDQSIYKFRGASVSNILHFKDDFTDAKEIFLNSNYRSCQQILDLSYEFICQNNPNRLEVKLSQANNLSKKLSSHSEQKAVIEHLHGETLQDEVNMVVNTIIRIYNEEPIPKWSDFAILVRANSSAEDFVYALEKAKIPYDFFASKGLYTKRIIIDLLSYLRLLDNHHEGPATYRVISLPFWGISHIDIVNLNYWADRKGCSLFEVLKNISNFENISEEAVLKIKSILAQIEKGTSLLREGKKTTEIIFDFLNSSGYLKNLVSNESKDTKEQLGYLNQFYKKAKEFEKENPDNTVKAFMQMIQLELESGEEGSIAKNTEDMSPDAVKIMTIHAAKGLEFEHVFIVNMVDKKFPAIGRADPIELPSKLVKEIIPDGDIHLQEERRLFYVAMTRAKKSLYFSSATDYGGVRTKKLSRFLVELESMGFALSPYSKKDKNEYEKIRKFEVLTSPVTQVPQKFSFTQIKAYENCPYQYHFAHILKIPTTGKPSFSFGTTMHSALQKFFEAVSIKEKVELDELYKIYDESFIDDWYPDQETKQIYYAKGKASLKLFYEKYILNKPSVRNLEFGFNIKIGDCGLKGKIDRIDSLGDGIRIVDYKTGKAKEKLSTEDKDQLLLYQIAAEELLKHKVTELSYYYLEEGREEKFIGKDKDIIKVKDKILKITEEIKKGNFSPKPSELCKYCDFNSICEFRK